MTVPRFCCAAAAPGAQIAASQQRTLETLVAEIKRLEAFARWVADYSNDPAVVREARAVLYVPPDAQRPGQ